MSIRPKSSMVTSVLSVEYQEIQNNKNTDAALSKLPGPNNIIKKSALSDVNHASILRPQKVLEDSIKIMVVMVEKWDAYTARHQIRVTNLAIALASEMNFPDAHIHRLNLASSIHDIGKIAVPLSILHKSSKLNNIEYSIVKEHPEVARDILINMAFQWPISEIVLQHHERLDGSGYPAGLKGKAILPEARILAVADVVDAMASDRSYRSALGITKALKEINMYRGLLYDADVVDACVKLFTRKGFQFEE